MANLRARQLRKNATMTERLLWRYLRLAKNDGLKFRRQHPIGPYIADFACLPARLVVEVDGYSHSLGTQAAHDLRRDAFLRKEGYHVARYGNEEIFYNGAEIADDILVLARDRAESLFLELQMTAPPLGEV